jgi:beta-1,2-mannobiose phosphorylase / 1,2-beta-oligomannan phosphorylase
MSIQATESLSKKAPELVLKRYEGNPILVPTEHWWESTAVFNAATVRAGGRVHMLYRAMGQDNISRLGYAVSADGLHFERFDEPAYEADHANPYERMGVEDPRITQIGDTFYVLYTAASLYPAEMAKCPPFYGVPQDKPCVPWRVRVAMASTKDFRKFLRYGVVIPDADSKDAILFPEKIGGRWVMFHRVYPNMTMAYSDDLLNWTDAGVVISPQPGLWDGERIGAGAQPIKTEKGWVLFYHGVDNWVYSLGLLVLDLEDPCKVIYRSQEPILRPETPHELEGLVPQVCFTCGAVEMDGTYYVYYGGADKVMSLATIGVDEVMRVIKK